MTTAPCPGIGQSEETLAPEGVDALVPTRDLARLNECLESVGAERSIAWAAETFGSGLVMSTSFGIQSAALLHMATRIRPDLPVLWIDTGYLPAETYRFAEQLTERLQLNLQVYQSPLSPARMEALYGQLWQQESLDALDRYDRIRKVEPMQRALRDLGATAWLSGVRSDQTHHRAGLPMLGNQDGRYKFSPLLRWSARDLHAYLVKHELPYHPLFDQGYATVGDWHSSRPAGADEDARETRFGGRKEECGLHLGDAGDESLVSSAL